MEHLGFLKFKVFLEELQPSLYLKQQVNHLLRLVKQLRMLQNSLAFLIVFVVLHSVLDFSHYFGKHALTLEDRHAGELEVFGVSHDLTFVIVYYLQLMHGISG